MPSLFVGIDIGTTNTKVVFIDSRGRPVNQASRGYPLRTPSPGFAEQDPDEIVEAVLGAFADAVSGFDWSASIEGVAFSSAMHGVLLLDEKRRPLTPLITWADSRSEAVAQRIRSTEEGYNIYRTTGTPIHAMTPLCKLVWFREHEPALFSQTAHIVSIKEYVCLKLFGELSIDHSIASATGMFDIENRLWHAPALELAGISSEQLSAPVPTGHRLPQLLPDVAQRLNLSEEIPFYIGASDGCLANLGVGAMQPGQAALTVGTSGALRVALPDPATDPKSRLFTYILDDSTYITGGAINSGGILVQWFRERFAGSDDAELERLLGEASRLPAGSDGLVCLPYILGERAPHWNSFDRGVFSGVQYQHTRAHFLRALLEGSALTLQQILSAIEELYDPVDVVYANGGFVQSPLWVQIMADVLNKPIVISPVAEGSAIGAALLAMCASGNQMPARDFEASIRDQTRFDPNPEKHDTYRKAAKVFSELYDRVRGLRVRRSGSTGLESESP